MLPHPRSGRISIISEASDNRGMAITWSICIPRSARYSDWIKKHHLIIIGAGNLGQALANYMNFERRGFIFTGVFDINEKLHGKMIRGMKVRPMEEMQEFVRENNIDIAVLTIPKEGAAAAAEKLVGMGIKAIWNFAHVDLDVPDSVQVENVHLSDSLIKLSYMINQYENELEEKEKNASGEA